jgi:purine-binding chemotaxis protein CheW
LNVELEIGSCKFELYNLQFPMERSDVDILAARKKAAERAKATRSERPAAEQEPAQPAAPEEPVTAAVPPAQRDHPEQDAVPEPSPVVAAAAPLPKREAAPPPTAAAADPIEQPGEERDLEMLSFLLGSEEYVVAVDRVREVLTPREITPVPHAAKYLLGVCSLRGTVMPIIDLNLRLGLSASARDEKSRIIVVSLGEDDQVGLFVDRVRGVVRFTPSAVQPAPETVEQGAGAEFLKGIARKNDRLYILLDVEKAAGA